MLVVSRRIEEGLRIGENIEIKILDVFSTDNSGSRKSKVASIGISAPKEVRILRGELAQTLRENEAAGQSVRDLTGAHLGELFKKKRAPLPFAEKEK